MATGLEHFNKLPEDCVSTIFSLTTPLDACRLSLVSSTFRSAAESDAVWDGFLPRDYQQILTRTFSALEYSSKKDLFSQLCDSVLLDGGNKSFAVEKSSGRKSYILSATELFILHGNDPSHWTWKFIPESRFSEVAELKTISSLEIKAKIQTQVLSPNTKYGAYLIMKISERAFGLDAIPSEISLTTPDDVVLNSTAYLCDNDNKGKQLESLFYANRMQMLKARVNHGDDQKLVSERVDGWLEIELGEFFTGEDDKEVSMSLSEIKGHQLKGGLIIEGIEVRPMY